MPTRKLFAAYRGDEFLCVGTSAEVAEWLGVDVKTVRYMSTPAYRRRMGDSTRRLVVEKVEVDWEGEIR